MDTLTPSQSELLTIEMAQLEGLGVLGALGLEAVKVAEATHKCRATLAGVLFFRDLGPPRRRDL